MGWPFELCGCKNRGRGFGELQKVLLHSYGEIYFKKFNLITLPIGVSKKGDFLEPLSGEATHLCQKSFLFKTFHQNWNKFKKF